METKYFASVKTEEIAGILMGKVDEYYRHLINTNRLAIWRKLYRQYYAGGFSCADIEATGKNRNLRKISINHFKSILQHIQVLTTNQRPAFEPRAVNSDYKTYEQTFLAKSLLDYYMAQCKLEDHINSTIERAVVFGEGWMYLEWDPYIGNIVVADEGPEKSGDLHFEVHAPWDIIRDVAAYNLEGHEWFIVRRTINKYELAAKYPDWADKIIDQPPFYSSRDISNIVNVENLTASTSDLIYFYTFIHKRTTAMPDGRLVHFCSDNVVPFDGKLPYQDYPLIACVPEVQSSTPFGYSISYDMLPIQKAHDAMESSILTNQMAFGVQSIKAEKGAGVEVTEVNEGLNLLQFNDGFKGPEGLSLVATAPEVFKHKAELIQEMETVSGVNSTARGNPDSNVRSGAFAALIHSTAIQFNKGLQRSYIRMLEELGTSIINVLKAYAKTERVAAIVGISNRSYLKSYKGDDVGGIDRVVVNAGNPIMRTAAGKLEIAEMLAERGLIKDIQQFVMVMETGDVKPVTEPQTAEMMLIKAENEKLIKGEEVSAIAIEDHPVHIINHKSVLSSPEAKEQPGLVESVLNHIDQHVQIMYSLPPHYLAVLGINPPMPPQQEQAGEEPGLNEQAAMPSLPQNPETGEQYNPVTGE